MRYRVRTCKHEQEYINAQCPSSGAHADFQTSVDGIARCGWDKNSKTFVRGNSCLWPQDFGRTTFNWSHVEPSTNHQSKQFNPWRLQVHVPQKFSHPQKWPDFKLARLGWAFVSLDHVWDFAVNMITQVSLCNIVCQLHLVTQNQSQMLNQLLFDIFEVWIYVHWQCQILNDKEYVTRLLYYVYSHTTTCWHWLYFCSCEGSAFTGVNNWVIWVGKKFGDLLMTHSYLAVILQALHLFYPCFRNSKSQLQVSVF